MPGAFGAVFKAKSTVSGAVVALKVVNNDVDVSFEINVLKMINNECAWIVGFEDSFRIDETTYVCLDSKAARCAGNRRPGALERRKSLVCAAAGWAR